MLEINMTIEVSCARENHGNQLLTDKRFVLIGAAGYVAPRHMKAVRDTGNTLVAALDISDSVGVIDSYFPDADFFTEFERFDRHVDLLRRKGEAIDYVSICSPNYLHDAHIRFALRSGAHAICEKPLVLNPWNLDGLLDVQRETGKDVYTILQLRLHPSIINLKTTIEASGADTRHDVDLTYITSRGHWYGISWKGNEKKSGGIATNIGVHFFDMLGFVFGDLRENILHHVTDTMAAGYLEYDRARVRWFLSVDAAHLPASASEAGQRTYRSITVDGEEIEFSGGFTDLHTVSYGHILKGGGFGLEDTRAAVETVSNIRRMQAVGKTGDFHPFLANLDE
jgi:UDP-N-acetyl-2-amino-2-deoxyglucuronate dehydrogenase